ncbi:MAG TPA: hypothetical protein VE398_20550 [Acidobacteriota bacterium]|nr:hypothetical protein [Acidobacteriota bacterium]
MDKPYGNLAHEPCRLLRWKAMFIDAPSDPTVPPSNDQSFWCSRTLLCIGPDGEVAMPKACAPGRSCYDELT